MPPIIITSGQRYIDIDAFACAYAYRELLLAEGKDAVVVFEGAINHSVTEYCRELAGSFFVSTPPTNIQEVVMVDISEPSHFASFVSDSNVTEVYDHHFGFESHWREKIGEKAKIEAVGACTTLIWEEFQKRNAGKITPASAELLALGIVSNTLNFGAGVTTDRDRDAFARLREHCSLSDETIARYFTDQEKTLLTNIPETLHGDTKTQEIASLKKIFTIGQIELWETESFVRKHENVIRETLSALGSPHWFLSAPSIHTGQTHFLADDPFTREILTQKIGATFEGALGTAPRLWLRKEILRELL